MSNAVFLFLFTNYETKGGKIWWDTYSDIAVRSALLETYSIRQVVFKRRNSLHVNRGEAGDSINLAI